MIPPAKPYFPKEDIEEIKTHVEKILSSGMLTLHKYTKEFEKRFAELCNVKYAVAVNSGTAALEIILRTFKLEPGDEVIIPTNTFSATAASIIFAGGKPVLTDIDSDTLCITAEEVQKHITAKTKGVIVVHIGGLICPDIKAIREICQDYGLFLVEDAAHAHGSSLNGEMAGSFGDASAFSFYPTKVITTGEGGIITTNDVNIYNFAVKLRDQGKDSYTSNLIVELGYNWRMQEISAAIGLVQLKRLSEIILKRNHIKKLYNNEFSKIDGLEPIRTPNNMVNNYYKYVLILDSNINRDKLKEELKKKGVKCGSEVYWPPLHLQPIYQKILNIQVGEFPNAEDVCRRMICPPIYTSMTIEDVNYVIESFKKTLERI